jgi:hypothetical protein
MSESNVLASIRLCLGKLPQVRAWRNSSGALYDSDRRLIKFGLGMDARHGIGSSDLIGFVVVLGIARFLAVEVKAPGARTEPQLLERQRNFVAMVRASGGYAGFAECDQDAIDIVNGGIGCGPH